MPALSQMVSDLNFPLGVIGLATIREADGLAQACAAHHICYGSVRRPWELSHEIRLAG